MIAPDAIRRIADEVMSLHASGCKALADGDIVWAQLKFSVANVKLRNLQRLLDEPESPPPPKPMRKLCVVGSEPEWFGRKANSGGPDDGNAA